MPGSAAAELYFIAAMMALIAIICTAAVYFFAKTYRREMREKAEREKVKNQKASDDGANEDDTNL